jgi:hypothetical protein
MLTASIAFVTLARAGAIDDITIAEHPMTFPQWDESFRGAAGGIIRDIAADGTVGLYRNLHDITDAAQNVKPSESPTVWKPVADPGAEFPDWSQPYGDFDAYDKGAKVSYGGAHWTSDLDGNVWQPGVYGWTEVTQ